MSVTSDNRMIAIPSIEVYSNNVILIKIVCISNFVKYENIVLTFVYAVSIFFAEWYYSPYWVLTSFNLYLQ